MDGNNLIKIIISRIKEQYLKEAIMTNKSNPSDFNDGVLIGLGNALSVIQNDIITYYGEESLEEYGIDFNCDDFRNLFQEDDSEEIIFKKSTSLFDGKGEED